MPKTFRRSLLSNVKKEKRGKKVETSTKVDLKQKYIRQFSAEKKSTSCLKIRKISFQRESERERERMLEIVGMCMCVREGAT